MTAHRYSLPRVVALPLEEVVNSELLAISLGNPSRQLVSLWRSRNGFPASFRDGRTTYSFTGEIQRWLETRKVTVRRL